MSYQIYAQKSAVLSSTAITLSSSSFGFSSTDYQLAQEAVITALSQNVNVSFTTVDPSTSFGVVVKVNENFVVHGSLAVLNLRVIAQASTAYITLTLLK